MPLVECMRVGMTEVGDADAMDVLSCWVVVVDVELGDWVPVVGVVL